MTNYRLQNRRRPAVKCQRAAEEVLVQLIKQENLLKSNLIESKPIFYSDTDAAAAGAAAASAANVATTIKMVVKTKAAARET